MSVLAQTSRHSGWEGRGSLIGMSLGLGHPLKKRTKNNPSFSNCSTRTHTQQLGKSMMSSILLLQTTSAHRNI